MKKLCDTCKFSIKLSSGVYCNHCELFGHSRGCEPENCTRYVKGKRIKVLDNERDLMRLRKSLTEKYGVSA